MTGSTESAIRPAFKRVLLKLSGNSFCRAGESGITMLEVSHVSEQIKRIHQSGVQLAIVCGGLQMAQVEIVGLVGIGREQGFICQYVDAARQATR